MTDRSAAPPRGADLGALSSEAIDAARLAASVEPGTGAVVTFEGRVRNVNDGRRVVRLHYDAYPAMAEEVFADILRRTRNTHLVSAVRVLHRTGTLEVGETAVAIAVQWVVVVGGLEANHDLDRGTAAGVATVFAAVALVLAAV